MSMNIYQKIQTVRVELQKFNLKKGGKNAFAGFNYYQLDDFIPALNQLMLQYGITTRFNIVNGIATLTVIDMDKVEDFVVFESPIASADIKGSTPIQCLGSIHTYMKRYLYQNAFEIVEPDLFDALVKSDKLELDKKEPQPQAPIVQEPKTAEQYMQELITAEQLQFIEGLGEKVVKWALKKFNVNHLSELFKEDADKIINAYKDKQKEKEGNQ